MTAEDRDLAVRQARMGRDAARELVGQETVGSAFIPPRAPAWPTAPPPASGNAPPCAWGDDAWHRAAKRVVLLPHVGDDFRRLLAEERGKRDA